MAGSMRGLAFPVGLIILAAGMGLAVGLLVAGTFNTLGFAAFPITMIGFWLVARAYRAPSRPR